jgi:hypothetical protein
MDDDDDDVDPLRVPRQHVCAHTRVVRARAAGAVGRGVASRVGIASRVGACATDDDDDDDDDDDGPRTPRGRGVSRESHVFARGWIVA